jgi:phytoene dehydrogenase-like protein
VGGLTEAQTQRITYQGNPALVDALAQLLREEGVEVQPFDETEERQDSSGVVQDVITELVVVSGTIRAVDAAIAKFRKRFTGRVSITTEPDDDR